MYQFYFEFITFVKEIHHFLWNTVESRFSNLLGEKYIETLYVIFDHSGFIRDLWSSLTESRVTK